MAKPNPLAQALKQTTEQTPPSVAVRQPVSTARPRAKSRNGRTLIGGFFAPEVHKALKMIAAEDETTLQALLAEGINAVFARRGKAEIAGLGVPDEE